LQTSVCGATEIATGKKATRSLKLITDWADTVKLRSAPKRLKFSALAKALTSPKRETEVLMLNTN